MVAYRVLLELNCTSSWRFSPAETGFVGFLPVDGTFVVFMASRRAELPELISLQHSSCGVRLVESL